MAVNRQMLAGLARKIINQQNRVGGVSGEVLRACRAAISGNATQSDAQTIFNFRGVTQTGSKQLRSDAKGIGRVSASIGNYSNLISTAMQGGIPGMGAGVGLLGSASADLEKLFRAPKFERLIENSIVAVVKKAQKIGVASDFLQRWGTDPASQIGGAVTAGAKALQTARGAVKLLGAASQYAGTALLAGEVLGEGLKYATGFVMGNENRERRRESQRRDDLVQSNPRLGQFEKHISRQQHEYEEHRATGWGALPGIGNSIANAADAKRSYFSGDVSLRPGGHDARTRGFDQTTQDLFDSGLNQKLDPYGVRALAAKRYYNKKSWTQTGGELEEALENERRWTGVSPNKEIEAGTTAEAKNMMATASEMRGQYLQAVKMRHWAQAETLRGRANETLPGTITHNPQEQYKILEGVRMSQKRWAISNMALSGPRDFR